MADKVLIVGDSFAADWTKKYPDQLGWPNLLGAHYNITNLAQAGASEYRIYKQLLSVDLAEFDIILVSHTSPYRIYTEYTVHENNILHQHCDLIYSDIKNLAISNPDYAAVETYFKKFFSLEYAEFCHATIIDKIKTLLTNFRSIHLSHQTTISLDFLDLSDLFDKHKGLINHYSDTGNRIVYNKILKELNQ